MIGLSFSWCSFSSSASNKQRAVVSTLLFTIAMLLMFHSIGEKFSLNFNTLGEKWGKLSHCNLRLCWPVEGWIVCQWADLMRQQMKNVIEIFQFTSFCFIMSNLQPLKEGEDAVQFANRVKSAIARQGGLTELPWWVMLSLFKLTDYLLVDFDWEVLPPLALWQITFNITLLPLGENEGVTSCVCMRNWKDQTNQMQPCETNKQTDLKKPKTNNPTNQKTRQTNKTQCI